ncbi:transposase [Chloroflexota bacterium]
MQGRKATPIKLDEREKAELEKLIKGHNTRQQIALRARIVLSASEGTSNAEIARRFGVSKDMPILWRRRWLDLQPIELKDLSVEERLEDLPRPGAPMRISAEQICKIEELACEKPEKSGRPITHWTGREIADEIKQRGIVEQISPRHAARLLKRSEDQTTPGTILAEQVEKG